MSNLSWLDALAVASFLIGAENLSENVSQSAMADAIHAAVDDIHRHLQEQDRRLEHMERILENAENQKNGQADQK